MRFQNDPTNQNKSISNNNNHHNENNNNKQLEDTKKEQEEENLEDVDPVCSFDVVSDCLSYDDQDFYVGTSTTKILTTATIITKLIIILMIMTIQVMKRPKKSK